MVCAEKDALKRLRLSTLQKCIAAIQMLAYGLLGDICNDYCRLGESTTFECMEVCCSHLRMF